MTKKNALSLALSELAKRAESHESFTASSLARGVSYSMRSYAQDLEDDNGSVPEDLVSLLRAAADLVDSDPYYCLDANPHRAPTVKDLLARGPKPSSTLEFAVQALEMAHLITAKDWIGSPCRLAAMLLAKNLIINEYGPEVGGEVYSSVCGLERCSKGEIKSIADSIWRQKANVESKEGRALRELIEALGGGRELTDPIVVSAMCEAKAVLRGS